MIRIFARNEVGMSEPLESEEPVKVLRPAGEFLLRWCKQSWHIRLQFLVDGFDAQARHASHIHNFGPLIKIIALSTLGQLKLNKSLPSRFEQMRCVRSLFR